MMEGEAVVAALKGCGDTHAVWIPDSELGRWEGALRRVAGFYTRGLRGRCARARSSRDLIFGRLPLGILGRERACPWPECNKTTGLVPERWRKTASVGAAGRRDARCAIASSSGQGGSSSIVVSASAGSARVQSSTA